MPARSLDLSAKRRRRSEGCLSKVRRQISHLFTDIDLASESPLPTHLSMQPVASHACHLS